MDLFYTEIENVGKNRYELQRKTGRSLVEYAAKNIFNIKNSEIEVIQNKPKFKYSNINFSISHSDKIVAVCFDDFPVGFDLELIKQRDYAAIAKRMNFNLENNTLESFYECWTKYEAEYKLQSKAKGRYSFIFENTYAAAVVSEEKNDIKSLLNIHKINAG